MKESKGFAIAGVALAVAVGLYLILKPKKASAQENQGTQDQGDQGVSHSPINPNPCPPTFVKCFNYDVSKKCYNPLVVNKTTGLNPNGTDPCAVDFPDYGYPS